MNKKLKSDFPNVDSDILHQDGSMIEELYHRLKYSIVKELYHRHKYLKICDNKFVISCN